MSAFGRVRSPTLIAALRADAVDDIQALLESFASRLAARGFRVAGVTQTRVPASATNRRKVALRELTSRVIYPISQDLGRGSVACNLDTGELAQACAAIEQAAQNGVDLIVINKFGKQEAARGGLCDAFRAAMVAKIPVVTAVSPHVVEEWRAFAGPLADFVPPRADALAAWWERLQLVR